MQLPRRGLFKAIPFLVILIGSQFMYNNCGRKLAGAEGEGADDQFAHSVQAQIRAGFEGSGQDVLTEVHSDLVRRVGDSTLLSDPDGRSVTIGYGEVPKGALAVTVCSKSEGRYACDILVDEKLDPGRSESEGQRRSASRYLSSVLRHEIGHAFGIGHVRELSHVMYPVHHSEQLREGAIQKFSADLAAFRELGPTGSGVPGWKN